MNIISRRDILKQIAERKPVAVGPASDFSKIWATDVFDLEKMKKALPKQVFNSLEKTLKVGAPLEKGVAALVADAMRKWAISRGAKYYSHVFYPLTGATAEKHDGFISINRDGKVISEFSGEQLLRGEPDASAFPNGGIRSTFEARGYTEWDVTSPAYLMETSNGATLCIPTVFVAWTGEALDKKTPLLRSNMAINRAVSKLLKILGHKKTAVVSSSAGPEQEYFLIDSAFAAARPDLLLAGRTLFGKASAKGQEFGDHYFGAIPERAQVFMQDVEEKLYRLGIPAKTHHNEVAPGQFEIAPLYENSNIASDHQQLIMITLKAYAKKHGFLCLLHEKPFKGVNGSGKHVNWSVRDANLGNLLDPGDTPHANMQFLLFCGAVIRGVHKFGSLLRAVVASAGNDHRLGANEAPPAIMSIYLGSQLTDVFEQVKAGNLKNSKKASLMNIGVDTLPPLPKDPGDRNRTSPFAFTGNRFEFRAVGSSQSVSDSLVAINTIAADSIDWIASKLEKLIERGKKIEDACTAVLKEIIDNHGLVIFNDNNYSEEWHREAKKRGLPNLKTCAEALPVLKSKEIISLFENQKTITPIELAARFEISAEQYIKTIDVEAKLILDIAKTKILPAAITYLTDQVECFGILKEFSLSRSNINFVAKKIKELQSSVAKLEKDFAKNKGSIEEQLKFYSQNILSGMDAVRTAADALEGEVADDYWPLPSYMEMLFMR
ncbi:MAG: glutamine synthetase III [Fibromonadaceae bacterium]|jgi:glutamine synthetase|nr:glutamine synthetase III [Fibromonadaceae bacterium]